MLGSGSSLFGKPSTPTTQPPPFGATSTPSLFGASTPAPNLTFGAGATSTPFGAQAPSTPFGAPATSTPFGASSTPLGATPSQPAQSLNFGFGNQSGLKTPATTQSTLFGNLGAKTTTAAPTLNFGLGSNANKGFTLGTTTTTAAPTTSAPLTFGFGSATTTAPSLNFGLGSSTTTTSQLSFGLGLTTSTASSGFGVQTTQSFGLNAAVSTSNVGLGAVTQTTATTSGLNPLSSLPPSTKPEKVETSKDRPVPPELISQVESLREYVKQQKSHSSEVSLASLKPISKVKEDAEILNRMIVKLERDLVKNRVSDKKLRSDLTRSIQDCEIVQRLSANQRGFPCDDSIAFEYFQNIISRFQAQAEALSSEFKEMERHVSCRINPVPFTPEELGTSMKRLYECFVALAGQYQTIHSNITALKQEVKRLQNKVEP